MADYTEVTQVGVDECSKQKGHQYITTFCDLAQSRVVFVAEGRSSGTFRKFRSFLGDKGIDSTQVTDLCTDMWEPYQMGAAKEFPDAAVTFDRYHLMTLLNRAIDQVRRTEVRTLPLLRNSRWLWLKSRRELSPRQLADLERLSLLDSKTGKAHQIKLTLQRLWSYTDPAEAEIFLKKWYVGATHSRLEPIIAAAKTIKRHWKGVLQFVTSRITTGIVEGLNSKIKTAMKRAYGFKSFEYLRTVIYLVAGTINIPLPTQS